MTEAEWLACDDPKEILAFVRGKTSDRKLRLFAVASCCRVLRLIYGDEGQEAVLLSERYADGQAPAEVLKSARHQIIDEGRGLSPAALTANLAAKAASDLDARSAASEAAWYAALAAGYECGLPDDPFGEPGSPTGQAEHHAALVAEQEAQAGLLREIFGPRPAPMAFAPEWRTDTAVTLARTMYDSRDFSAMPILADALQDAGCDNDDILGHCRGDGPHVRGCWVCDLVLGKE